MAQRPSEKPDWIPDDTTGITAPNGAKRAAGWILEKPPFQYFNWFWNLLSQWADFFGGQAEEWIVIDSDADEQDYATLAAYLADAPAAGDKVLVKGDQTITAQMVWPSGITVKFLDGARLLCATNIATSVLQLGSDIVIEGVLEIVLSQTGVTALAVEFNGDNVTGKINIENSSTGTLTLAAQINASKTGNQVSGFVDNTGGGTLSGVLTDSSTEDSNNVAFVDGINNIIVRARGANTMQDGFKFTLGSDAAGDIYYNNGTKLVPLAADPNSSFLQVSQGVPSYKSIEYSFISQVGSDLNIPSLTQAVAALDNNTIAYYDSSNTQLRTYRFNGSTWSQVGNSLTITGGGIGKLAALSSTRVAFIDDSNEDLRTYDFDGTDWSQTGNDLNIPTIAALAIAALGPLRIAYIDSTNADLRVYDFDGTDWSQTGNDLNITGVTNPALTALGPLRVAFIDDGNDDLRVYDFDGTDWSQTGNDLNIAGIGLPALAGLNESDIAFIDVTNADLRIYRFDGTDFAEVGVELNISGVSLIVSLAALTGDSVAFIDGGNDDLRTYQWGYTFTAPYRP